MYDQSLILQALREQRAVLEEQIGKIDTAFRILSADEPVVDNVLQMPRKHGRHMSAAVKARLSRLAKERWAEKKAKAEKKGRRKLHWTQQPARKAAMMKHMRKMSRLRDAKAA